MSDLVRWLLARLLGPACPACGEHVRAERLSLHWHVEHAGELQ